MVILYVILYVTISWLMINDGDWWLIVVMMENKLTISWVMCLPPNSDQKPTTELWRRTLLFWWIWPFVMGSIFPNSTGQFLVCAVEFTRLLSNSAFLFGKVCPCFPWTDHCQWNHDMFTHKTTMFHHVLAIKPPLFIISKPKKPHKSTTGHRFLIHKTTILSHFVPVKPSMFSPLHHRGATCRSLGRSKAHMAAKAVWAEGRSLGSCTVGDPMDRMGNFYRERMVGITR